MKSFDKLKQLIIVWAYFLLSLLLEIIISIILRYKDGKLMTGTVGMSEGLWFFYQFFVFLIFVCLLFKLKKSLSLFKRILFVGINLCIAYLLYAIIILFYVVGTRVDSM